MNIHARLVAEVEGRSKPGHEKPTCNPLGRSPKQLCRLYYLDMGLSLEHLTDDPRLVSQSPVGCQEGLHFTGRKGDQQTTRSFGAEGQELLLVP